MKDIKNCIVGILIDGELRGTGYLVTNRCVLTCAHVLTDNDKPPETGVSVQFYCDRSTYPVDVVEGSWSPAKDDDIAVLSICFDGEGQIPAGAEIALLAHSANRRNRNCEVFGFPDLANIAGAGGRATIIEDIREFEGRELLQLDSKEATCGFSGSPLLDVQTGEVVGTCVEIVEIAGARHNAALHGRLSGVSFATPMEAIARIAPDLPIQNEADTETRDVVRSRVLTAVQTILEGQTKVVQFLEKQIDKTTNSLGGESQESISRLAPDEKKKEIAKYLLRIRLEDFIPLIVNGYTASCRFPDNDESNIYRELAAYILPQIYNEAFLRELHRTVNAGGNFIAIPSSHKSIIELIVSGALGRKLQLEDWLSDNECPSGKLQISPCAEIGILGEQTMERFLKAFEDALMQKPMIGRFCAELPDPTRAINERLEELRDREPPIMFYYLYDAGHGRIPELEIRYPSVIFVEREPTGHNSLEAKILYCLYEMFSPAMDVD